MKIEKIDFAKKLIKFDKVVEAAKVLENILDESNDKILLKNVIELLLVEIEFKQPIMNNEKVHYLINLYKKNEGEQDKIKFFESMFKEKKSIQKQESKLEFTMHFKEVYNFFEQKFLNKNLEIIGDQKKIEIVDFELAKNIAHNQDIENPYESWNDLRSDITKQVYSFIFKEKINLDLFENEINKLNKVLENKLENTNTVFYYFLDDVEADIHLILLACYIEFKDNFIDLMLDVYQCNFFPCGWKGEFPLGRLCVTDGMQKFDK